MMMRYNFGLSVGHTYAHDQFSSVERAADGPCDATREDENELDSALPDSHQATVLATGSDSEDSSIDCEDLDADMWEDKFSDRDESDDEEFLAMNDMYAC
jgi:hypothetical protein